MARISPSEKQEGGGRVVSRAESVDGSNFKWASSSEVTRRSLQANRKDPEVSWFAFIERAAWFQNTTLVVIVINAFWIFVDVEWNHIKLQTCDENGKKCSLPLEPFSIIIENLFCFYFFIEVVIRFCAFEKIYRCIFDAWFVFDSVLVAFMVIETWILVLIDFLMQSDGGGGALNAFSSFRLLRLLRLTRMARIMRFCPELMTLVKGIVRAVSAVGFILLFLVMVMAVFAIVFTGQLGSPSLGEVEEEEPANYTGLNTTELIAMVEDLKTQVCEDDPTAEMMFATLGDSMMTLFTNGVLGDNLAQTLGAIKSHPDSGLVLFWLFIVFMCISSVTLLNMLIGVLCTVIGETATEEQEADNKRQWQETLEEAFVEIDTSGNGMINQKEWADIKRMNSVRNSLKNLGVPENQLEERLNQMQETLFGNRLDNEMSANPTKSETMRSFARENEPGYTMQEFMDRVVELRWDLPAEALDVEMLKSVVRMEDLAMNKSLDSIEANLEQLLEHSGSQNQIPLSIQDGSVNDVGEAPDADAAFLQGVPTELLFHVLKTREPPTPALSDRGM